MSSPSSSSTSSSSGGVPLEAVGGSDVLASLKLWHDVDSVVTEELLGELRDRYCIPECYGLIAPRSGQRSYD